MIGKNLARRLERLEERHAVTSNVPKIVIVAVDSDGHVCGRYRMTPTGLEPLEPDDELQTETPRGR
jgi:hypothetical protein